MSLPWGCHRQYVSILTSIHPVIYSIQGQCMSQLRYYHNLSFMYDGVSCPSNILEDSIRYVVHWPVMFSAQIRGAPCKRKWVGWGKEKQWLSLCFKPEQPRQILSVLRKMWLLIVVLTWIVEWLVLVYPRRDKRTDIFYRLGWGVGGFWLSQ